MNDMTPIDATVPDEATVLFSHTRTVIDLLSMTRATTMRVALLATFLCRPNPSKDANAETSEAWLEELQGALGDLERLIAILRGQDPQDDIAPSVCKWVAKHAKLNAEVVNAVKRTHELTKNIVKAAQSGDPANLEHALETHLDLWHAGLHQTITEFCSELWSEQELERDHEVTSSKATAETISTTLTRLAHIGKHVRLVALNASVEAARVGDAGKGLGVIAVEFKSLAEEIQHLAASASEEIRNLSADAQSTSD